MRETAERLRPVDSTLLHAAFFLSGASALVYEVLWMRRFTVLLGATAPATAATLSAIFLGLGAGSALFGSFAGRVKRPLRAFAILEAGIGLAALGVEPLLRPAQAMPAGTAVLLAARMALAMMAILPAALLMGGSLPVLAQALAGGNRGLGVLGGGLYALNTAGAAAGAMIVPVLLLPALGASGSVRVAVVASLGVAALALLIDARTPPAGAIARAAIPRPAAGHAPPSGMAWVLAAAFVSGASTLGLEVLFTRMLALIHENSLYSFATVLAVFLAGLAAGAALARRLLARGHPARRIAAAGWIGAGLWVMAAPGLFHGMTSGLRYTEGRAGLLAHEMHLAVLALAVMLPATLFAGAVLPALMQEAGRASARTPAASLGALLCANTLGALAGPWIALFVAGPTLGLWWSLAAFGVVMLCAGEMALRGGMRAGEPPRSPARLRPARRIAWYAAGVVLLALWRPGELPAVRLEPDERLVDLSEGPFGTVAVVDRGRSRRLMLNNSYVLGGTASLGEERLQAHIPLLLHPAPRRVALLGLGTGITASGVTFHPVERVVAMELVEEVVSAARRHFREANLGVLEDPRVRVLVEDARTALRATRERFDVIVGDLVVPWRRGEASLYTQESFVSARDALAPGGLFCQWVPLFQLSRAEFDTIVATFLDVFPRAVLWKGDFRAGEPAAALIGFLEGTPLDPGAIEGRWRAYAGRPDPANPWLADAAGLWAYLAGPLTPDDPAVRAARRSSDDRPVLELHSPAAQFGGGPPAFAGEPLRQYLEELMARPLARTPLEKLGENHLRWRTAGMEIWSASLLELQGRREEADALGLRGMARLPGALQRAVLGRPAASP